MLNNYLLTSSYLVTHLFKAIFFDPIANSYTGLKPCGNRIHITDSARHFDVLMVAK